MARGVAVLKPALLWFKNNSRCEAFWIQTMADVHTHNFACLIYCCKYLSCHTSLPLLHDLSGARLNVLSFAEYSWFTLSGTLLDMSSPSTHPLKLFRKICVYLNCVCWIWYACKSHDNQGSIWLCMMFCVQCYIFCHVYEHKIWAQKLSIEVVQTPSGPGKWGVP